MSNLNNVYGNSNSCPPIMNDGRGANTNFKPKNEYFQDIKKKVGSETILELKKNLRIDDVREPLDEFQCSNVPDGAVNVSKNIGGLLLTQGGSWRNNFASLK